MIPAYFGRHVCHFQFAFLGSVLAALIAFCLAGSMVKPMLSGSWLYFYTDSFTSVNIVQDTDINMSGVGTACKKDRPPDEIVKNLSVHFLKCNIHYKIIVISICVF